MKCTACGHENRVEARFCGDCAESLGRALGLATIKQRTGSNAAVQALTHRSQTIVDKLARSMSHTDLVGALRREFDRYAGALRP